MFTKLPDEHREAIRSMYPVGEPSDIADVIVFLAGPQARWINAVTVGTNNGVVLN
jgi:3-oxoacyl-[acyl-carrier protein] reductase